ncbi:MAG: (d)CMP kinase [Candidatus Cloacimonetes bacterium]|nr:(d)CMP kinase [Candidatus Cloacimonadota bacterium]MBL7108492.1 (d)CMP kinase [Candidatus Cloacimonadota bacterium]
MKEKFVIAIDGPASSGKSTTAKLLAAKLNCVYIDSGSMYRAVALFFIENDINLESENEIEKFLSKIDIEIKYNSKKNENSIFLNGKDVSRKIRKSDVTKISSIVATKKNVRKKMVELQRKIAEKNSVIMDGRDIGTVVFPDADFKFFITASLKERAERRWKEMQSKKLSNLSFEEIMKELKWRDKTDSTRKIAPLKMADDAVLVDTTNLTIEQQVEKIIEIIER